MKLVMYILVLFQEEHVKLKAAVLEDDTIMVESLLSEDNGLVDYKFEVCKWSLSWL